MARGTFQKRQKEMKRKEKMQMKAERRAQRKIEKSKGTGSLVDGQDLSPELEDSHLEIEGHGDEPHAGEN